MVAVKDDPWGSGGDVRIRVNDLQLSVKPINETSGSASTNSMSLGEVPMPNYNFHNIVELEQYRPKRGSREVSLRTREVLVVDVVVALSFAIALGSVVWLVSALDTLDAPSIVVSSFLMTCSLLVGVAASVVNVSAVRRK